MFVKRTKKGQIRELIDNLTEVIRLGKEINYDSFVDHMVEAERILKDAVAEMPDVIRGPKFEALRATLFRTKDMARVMSKATKTVNRHIDEALEVLPSLLNLPKGTIAKLNKSAQVQRKMLKMKKEGDMFVVHLKSSVKFR